MILNGIEITPESLKAQWNPTIKLGTKAPFWARFWDYVDRTPAGCWIWRGNLNPEGYGRIRPKLKTQMAHRVMYEAVHGPIPNSMFVCHRCDRPSCVNPDHLFLGTPKDNTQDMVKKRRGKYGEKHHSAKLTEEKVREIRVLIKTGVFMRKIARDYGVDQGIVQGIKKNKIWRHVA